MEWVEFAKTVGPAAAVAVLMVWMFLGYMERKDIRHHNERENTAEAIRQMTATLGELSGRVGDDTG